MNFWNHVRAEIAYKNITYLNRIKSIERMKALTDKPNGYKDAIAKLRILLRERRI